jgi:hypothetical protein
MKKLIGKTLIALAFVGSSAPSVYAQETEEIAAVISDQEMDTAAANIAQAAKPDVSDPGMKIEALIEDFEASPLGQAFRDRPGMFYATAISSVMVGPENRDWGNARVMAYKDALLKAQAKYVEYLGVSVRAESLSRLFDDKSQMPSFTEADLRANGKLGELFDKAVAVVGGKLDGELQEMGIDPAEFRAAPVEKRAKMFERSVSENTVTRARQSLTGVIPVKTFEAYNENGDHAVAVAIVASSKFRQFVHDITQSKGDIAADPSKANKQPLLQLLRADKTALIDEFGIRRMYDEQGYPVLVSFGQSSNPYRGDDFQQRSDNRELSYASAKSASYANFAYLFNATGSTEQAESRKMTRETIGVAQAEGQNVTESEEQTLQFVSTMDRQIAARGSISNLPGTRELFRWSANHPQYGHEINGVVYIWHPLAEQNARGLRDFKPTRTSQNAQPAQNRSSGQAGTSQSRNLMSADDF